MSEQEEKQRLIKQMGSSDNQTALAAVEALRQRGWLQDGSMKEVNLHSANLRGVELSGALLIKTDLRKAILADAKLTNAKLFEVDLSEADLSNADLGNAELAETDFINANLFGVDLSGITTWDVSFHSANLREVNLTFANLMGVVLNDADLTGAKFDSTVLADVDLSATRGLETIIHTGPSYITIDTLSLSKGKIPPFFLRGCGVPENLITYLPSLLGNAIEFFSCFISYSHTDKPFARRLHDTLQGRGIRCWLDEKQMNPGDDIYEEVDRGIRLWDKVLLCCSQHSLTSWWVDNEMDTAFQKERESMKDRGKKVLALIPLDLDGYLFSDDFKSGKKQQIISRLAADFKGWEHDNAIFEHEIERIIKALRTDGGKALPPTPEL